MIPLQLTLKNFLSYRETSLDFRGLHVACISGANGAGKSSLLEAIAWSVWGESRAMTEDDVIHQGEMEARVDFTFECHGQTYRAIRTRHRGQSSSLEFQIQTEKGFRSLTEKGLRATQQRIIHILRLDYETFVNSAYLRQGRADEFMLKRPSERKQILADLLKLDQYETLAEQSKERSRQVKAELDVLERHLDGITRQMEESGAIAVELDNLQANLTTLQQEQAGDTKTLRQLQAVQQQRQSWVQQLNLQQQQQTHLSQDSQRLKQELSLSQHQQAALEAVLHSAGAIAAGYTEFHSLQTEEEAQTAKFHAHQAAIARRQELQQQLEAIASTLKQQIARLQAQLEALQQQQEELQHALRKADDLEAALSHLHQARIRLTELDQLQTRATPLLQRQQQLQSQLELHRARLSARLDNLQATTQSLQTQQHRHPQLQQAVLEVSQFATYLEKRRTYQQKVREKGTERRTFMERLQEDQRKCEQQLAAVDQKIALLQKDEGGGMKDEGGEREEVGRRKDEERAVLNGNGKGKLKQRTRPRVEPSATLEPSGEVALLDSPASSSLLSSPALPPCPLCDRPLDDHHRTLVLKNYQQEREEVLRQIWVIREQLTASEREIQVLRQEYRDLDKELSQYTAVLEKRGQLQEQLQGVAEVEQRLQQAMQEQEAIVHSLENNAFLPELQDELHRLEQTLQQLNYDDRDHALARGEVDRWRWAEIRQAELKTAQRRLAQLQAKQPQLTAQLAELQQQLADLGNSPEQQQLTQVDREIAAIAYDMQRHTALRKALRQAQVWQFRHQELTQAQQQYPQVKQRVKDLKKLVQQRNEMLQSVTQQIEGLVAELEKTPDPTTPLQTLERQIQERRDCLDEAIARVGRLQQQQQQLDDLKQQEAELKQQKVALARQLRIYQELTQAFGKNGIQALMIENVLPHLETEANRILGQLSNHQLHIQFVTQRSRQGSRSSRARLENPKLIETLDILIADARGTRPYETYSGGEAFRVNFSIRLALARLLAQRSGTALQLLIVDEGFGTQDEAGCDRLIAAIQAIAPDFACILTVTHMPRFKEAFQTRIEVVKDQNGSQLSLSF